MRGRFSLRRPLLASLVVAIGAAFPGAASALFLTQEQQLVETLKAAQGADATYVGAGFGPDPNSPLSFTSNVDLAANTFSYALAPGSTYLGQSISITGSGAFDTGLGLYDVSSAITLGATSWTTSSTAQFVGDPLVFSGTIFGIPVSLSISEDYSAVGAQLISNGHLDLKINTKTYRGSITDVKDAAGNWVWDMSSIMIAGAPPFRVDGGGFVPPGGGAGAFVTVVGVPEPASVALLGAGAILFLGVASRKANRRQSAR